MSKIDDYAKMLTVEIKQSEEYNQYHRLKTMLSNDLELYAKVNTFRKKNFILQNKENEQDDILKIEQLEKEYFSILSMTSVKEFLLAEQRLCRLISRISGIICEAADFDLDFIDAPEE